jgi:hypothetical protein
MTCLQVRRILCVTVLHLIDFTLPQITLINIILNIILIFLSLVSFFMNKFQNYVSIFELIHNNRMWPDINVCIFMSNKCKSCWTLHCIDWWIFAFSNLQTCHRVASKQRFLQCEIGGSWSGIYKKSSHLRCYVMYIGNFASWHSITLEKLWCSSALPWEVCISPNNSKEQSPWKAVNSSACSEITLHFIEHKDYLTYLIFLMKFLILSLSGTTMLFTVSPSCINFTWISALQTDVGKKRILWWKRVIYQI